MYNDILVKSVLKILLEYILHKKQLKAWKLNWNLKNWNVKLIEIKNLIHFVLIFNYLRIFCEMKTITMIEAKVLWLNYNRNIPWKYVSTKKGYKLNKKKIYNYTITMTIVKHYNFKFCANLEGNYLVHQTLTFFFVCL